MSFLAFLASISLLLFPIFFQVMTDDGNYISMPPGFPKFEIEEGEKKFVFRIPKFNDNVIVDPSVNVGKVKSAASSWSRVNVGVALLVQFAAMFALHYN